MKNPQITKKFPKCLQITGKLNKLIRTVPTFNSFNDILTKCLKLTENLVIGFSNI